ncbi:response regulator [uncultured Desulfosarcina sp.]|uniref:response regulator n=1 Tax=uncultured Desulfosarcina sp. TaxID=218289 RepID=UPI0029C6ACD2|nr:response regulator [uncultured Desulfosarcina sp.]
MRNEKESGMIRRTAMLMAAVLLGIALHAGSSRAAGNGSPLKIGVLAIRGPEQCLKSWTPTAAYLTRQIPGQRFVIVPLTHDQVYPAVETGAVDFILVNSAFYVGVEHWYRANRIVTLKERRANGVYTRYGGVIFCRRDHSDIRELADLKGKSFMAVSESSLGGWLMAWREFQENGIDPFRDFNPMRFNETHDDVVFSVRDRLVDAGTVRTNTLEELSAEGKIDLDDFYVFAPLHPAEKDRPYLCTTREYPDWPMAKVRHTPDDLAEKVAVALMQMPADAKAARVAGCAGWTIPLNYQPVHDCLRALKVGPYEDLGKISFRDVLETYGPWIIFTCAAFCILAAFTGVVLKLNRRIRTSNERLKVEMDLRRQRDRELQSAKNVAEDATRAKSEFLANMSHEIRTPMNGVIAATELALSEEVTPKIAHYLKIVQSSAYSLLGIINDILDFSKIEAGKMELKSRTFRLNEVFDRVIELFVNKAREKEIELLVDIDPESPKILIGDPLRLQQILTNLVSNAIKFTDSGGVILLRVKPGESPPEDTADGQQVVLAFSVKDTGTGIDPAYIDMLFEPFSQADTSSTRKYEGTGLGLSICKQLVTLMAGDIGVTSEPGVGSTFSFTVRMQRPSATPTVRPQIPPDILGLNVLVVDDMADSRTIMRNMLSSLGFRVETLSSGSEALSRLTDNPLRNNPIELIMMDWKMPEMDGFEVSRKIRQEMKLTLPIIMMTAFGKEEQRIAAEESGINGFLLKPIYPSTLFDAIMDAFGKSGLKTDERIKHFTTRASIYRKPLKGARILVAEDNPTNQQVAQAILEGAGIVVTIVGDGEEAVEAVRAHTFDAVLMDIQMPRMNGYEATRLIRNLPEGKTIPVVAMTAHAMKGDEEKCLEAGMDGYISKPVNQDRLFHTLWRLLRARGRLPDIHAGNGGGVENETGPATAEAAPAPVSSPSTVGRRLPDRLPGIDIRETLAALDIDGDTLTRILHGFLDNNRQTADRLRQALAAGDMTTVAHLAHALKGSAANIGANELSSAARALEMACKEDLSAEERSSRLGDRIENLAAALEPVLRSIQSLRPTVCDTTAAPAAAQVDGSFDSLLSRLADAIDRADPEQVMAIMPLVRQQAAGQPIDSARIDTLEAQVNRYDYDQALETIKKICDPSQGVP